MGRAGGENQRKKGRSRVCVRLHLTIPVLTARVPSPLYTGEVCVGGEGWASVAAVTCTRIAVGRGREEGVAIAFVIVLLLRRTGARKGGRGDRRKGKMNVGRGGSAGEVRLTGPGSQTRSCKKTPTTHDVARACHARRGAHATRSLAPVRLHERAATAA